LSIYSYDLSFQVIANH